MVHLLGVAVGVFIGAVITNAVLKILGTSTRTDDWIPVSERLPELEQIVLTTSEPLNTFQRDVDTARRTNDGWRWGDDSRVSSGWTIVAWMPLPEVYKESK